MLDAGCWMLDVGPWSYAIYLLPASVNKNKKVSWNLAVDGKAENKLQLSYAVKYPRDKNVMLD
jgi:hypothetical protein